MYLLFSPIIWSLCLDHLPATSFAGLACVDYLPPAILVYTGFTFSLSDFPVYLKFCSLFLSLPLHLCSWGVSLFCFLSLWSWSGVSPWSFHLSPWSVDPSHSLHHWIWGVSSFLFLCLCFCRSLLWLPCSSSITPVAMRAPWYLCVWLKSSFPRTAVSSFSLHRPGCMFILPPWIP